MKKAHKLHEKEIDLLHIVRQMRVYDKALVGLMTKVQLKFTRKLSEVVIEDGSEEH